MKILTCFFYLLFLVIPFAYGQSSKDASSSKLTVPQKQAQTKGNQKTLTPFKPTPPLSQKAASKQSVPTNRNKSENAGPSADAQKSTASTASENVKSSDKATAASASDFGKKRALSAENKVSEQPKKTEEKSEKKPSSSEKSTDKKTALNNNSASEYSSVQANPKPVAAKKEPESLEDKLKALFSDTNGAFVLYESQSGTLVIYNPQRAEERFSPFSTFDIAAAAILLDSGILKSADQVVPWNKDLYPAHPGLPKKLKKEWEADHSLKTAYNAYAGWFFQSLITETEYDEMSDYLNRFLYGNQAHHTDNFWIGKPLSISATEQVAFLHGLRTNSFNLKPDIQSQIFPLMITDKNDQYTLAIKTGSGVFAAGKSFGWAVGYVTVKNTMYYFAMNLDADNYAALTEKRQKIIQGVLQALGLKPKEKDPQLDSDVSKKLKKDPVKDRKKENVKEPKKEVQQEPEKDATVTKMIDNPE